jgi:flagellin
MIINHNLNAMNAHRNLVANNISQGKSSEKLSSGYRINRAADDAAGLSISEKMRAQIKGLNQAQSNVQDGVSLVQTAEGAMTEVSDMLVRMKELAVKAGNSTYNTSDITAIKSEWDALVTAIDNVVNKTRFNGSTLLDGTTTLTVQSGEKNGDQITQAAIDIKIATLGIDSVTLATTSDSGNAIDKVDGAIDKVNTARSDLGAKQNQLEHTFNNLAATAENLQSAESRVRDTDMAKEMMTYTKFNILQQAATAMLAQANQAPQGVLQLLR